MDDDLEKYFKEFMKIMPTEDLYFEAVRDIVKDLIKEYIKKKMNEDETIRKDLARVIEEFMDARIKEYDAVASMAKIVAKIGLVSAPDDVKEQVYNDFITMFQKEIEGIIKKTL
ncbi:TVG1442264 [Thermoplasma volcanium GSS1]|uniref:TVG1442264 protein n=1 Tax=Thermoplasma volcanium (strain ATCC 51530 / DSM 4299 / JCM 9571 / NBRC 15438 / GSS1) TaxID=273116 RepID=Q978L8_THEVO|nr:nitrate/sulfite reductase [Thermoplasma volcanium]BAB60539.1 TVG1442264 [Thermoplasma volcanium GSS1]